MTTSAKACVACGTPLPEDALFCRRCGAATPTDPGVPPRTAVTEAGEVVRVVKEMRPELAATLGTERFLRGVEISAQLQEKLQEGHVP